MKKEIKFTQEEQDNILNLSQEYSNLYRELGQNTLNRRMIKLQYEKQLKELEETNETLLTNIIEVSNKEEEMVKSVTEKYGVGNYNPETGVFTPQE